MLRVYFKFPERDPETGNLFHLDVESYGVDTHKHFGNKWVFFNLPGEKHAECPVDNVVFIKEIHPNQAGLSTDGEEELIH